MWVNLNRFPLNAPSKIVCARLRRLCLKRRPIVAVVLMLATFGSGVSLVARASLTREGGESTSRSRIRPPSQDHQNRRMPSFPPSPAHQPPQAPPTKDQREARVFRIQLNVDKQQSIASGQRFAIGAVPLDQEGNPIHGLRVEWSTSDKVTVFVTKDGQAIGGKVGT